jgi:hypothetical protein
VSRVQLALNVADLEEPVDFYIKIKLFATEPAQVRPGYANFAVLDPPLKPDRRRHPGRMPGGRLCADNDCEVESCAAPVDEADNRSAACC